VSGTADDLPPLLATIAELAGEPAALAVAREYGGTRVTVPMRARGRNWLTAIVGPAAAERVIAQLGGARRIDIPLGPEAQLHGSRRAFERHFEELMAQGKSVTSMARLLGVTERTVRNRRRARRSRAELARDVRQGDLFG